MAMPLQHGFLGLEDLVFAAGRGRTVEVMDKQYLHDDVPIGVFEVTGTTILLKMVI